MVRKRCTHRISRMRYNCAEHTSDVSRRECDDQLFTLCALLSWLRNYVFVQELERALEASKLHHRVWDLTKPQRYQPFVEAAKTFVRVHLRERFSQSIGVSWHGLDPDLFHITIYIIYRTVNDAQINSCSKKLTIYRILDMTRQACGSVGAMRRNERTILSCFGCRRSHGNAQIVRE